MTTHSIAPAVIEYIDHGTYPDTDTACLELTPSTLTELLSELTRVQDQVKDEVRQLSKSTAPNVDSWISRAKELQSDIQRSRLTARAIVEEAEAGKTLKAEVKDAQQKVVLLEQEVGFNETLVSTLEHIGHVNRLLDEAQEAAVQSDIENALVHLEEVESSISGLKESRASTACELLSDRARQQKDSITEITTSQWNSIIAVSQEHARLRVIPTSSKLGLAGVTGAAKSLGIYADLITRLGRDIDRAIVRPRLAVTEPVRKLEVAGNELSCADTSDDISLSALFVDFRAMLEYLHRNLAPISKDLSEVLLPLLIKRLEESWLDPSVPLDIPGLTSFYEVLQDISSLAEQLENLQWHGAKDLRTWVQNAPKVWLTKRREAILGDTRNLVFTGLRSTKVVERVETQMIKEDDALATNGEDVTTGEGGEEDDWGAAWDEGEAPDAADVAEPSTLETPADDEDISAWDTEDTTHRDATGSTEAAGEEEEAWGWGDEDVKTPSPVVAKSDVKRQMNNQTEAKAQTTDREVTLRELFTATLVPDGIMSILEGIVSDAQTLAQPEHASSPVAPAASALYTLPTLSLAIYRATAPTAFAKLETGNMLIYNDASHLASRLRDWQASQPPASRLRVDNDVKALETFAKRAYSSEMESQRTILRDLLDGAQGFSNSTIHPYKLECESAIEQTVHRIREVHRQWKDILSQGALLQSLGSLLSTVIAKMVTEIEELSDISEADSHQLTALCHKVAETKDLFMQTKPARGSGEEQEAADMTFIYCPNWLKFQYLAEILESSLADIKYLWHEGELSLEFEADEVVDLITALFAESDLRKRAVAEIKRNGRR